MLKGDVAQACRQTQTLLASPSPLLIRDVLSALQKIRLDSTYFVNEYEHCLTLPLSLNFSHLLGKRAIEIERYTINIKN